MNMQERIKLRIAELDELIRKHDEDASVHLGLGQRHAEKLERDKARGYAQARLELRRLLVDEGAA